jgi:hypothetical protein
MFAVGTACGGVYTQAKSLNDPVGAFSVRNVVVVDMRVSGLPSARFSVS